MTISPANIMSTEVSLSNNQVHKPDIFGTGDFPSLPFTQASGRLNAEELTPVDAARQSPKGSHSVSMCAQMPD